MPFLMDLGRGDEEFRRLCEIIGMAEVAADPRFSGFRERAFNEPELKQTLNPALSQWGFEELRALIQDGLGGTILPMNNAATLMGSAQVDALEIVQDLDHPVVGRYRTVDIPWDFSEEIARLSDKPAPLLGQDSVALLTELGYSEAQIESMVRDKVLVRR